MKRSQKIIIQSDLQKKIVFLVGPRQVGKTWLAKDIAKSYENAQYLNYDRKEDRDIIHLESWLEKTNLLILDELHKMDGWKNYLKGIYDTKPEHLQILVTGSARLDVSRYIGDSLLGRFYLHRLLPFSPREFSEIQHEFTLSKLIERSGFPEPYLSEAERDVLRWRNNYIDGLVRFDVLEYENIQEIRYFKLILDMLRERVGSPISYNAIAEEMKKSPNTVKRYIQIMENLYIIFQITPFSKMISRSILKQPKIYFYDTGMVKGDTGKKLENLVALSLQKYMYELIDQQGEDVRVHYLRTKDGKEVDFAFSRNGLLECMIEVKYNDAHIDKNVLYFSEKYSLPATQVVMNLKRERKINDLVDVRKAKEYLSNLNI